MTSANRIPPLIPELGCTDFTKSLAFYTQTLGFNVDYQRPEEGFAMLERQGAYLMIDQIGIGRTWIPGAMEYPFGRGINIQIETENVETLYTSVQDSGAPIFLPIEEKLYRRDDMMLGTRQFIVQDPDGYLLRFYQDLGIRPAWLESTRRPVKETYRTHQ